MNGYDDYQIWNPVYVSHSLEPPCSSDASTQVESPHLLFGLGDDTSDAFRRDALTLAEMLRPVYLPADTPLAQQVFGSQMRQQKLSVEHILNLINERTVLHKRILDDIAHSHMDMQGQLYGARLHANMDGHARELKVLRFLLQLDEQRRREEVDFWKDTAELREKLFEVAGEYQALRHRTSVFESIEPREGVYA